MRDRESAHTGMRPSTSPFAWLLLHLVVWAPPRCEAGHTYTLYDCTVYGTGQNECSLTGTYCNYGTWCRHANRAGRHVELPRLLLHLLQRAAGRPVSGLLPPAAPAVTAAAAESTATTLAAPSRRRRPRRDH